MSVKIRLARTGRHSTATYRLVAADSRFSRDGRYIEQVGYYDPQLPLEKAVIDDALVLKWLQLGAQPSDSVRTLLQLNGVLAKFFATKKPSSKKKNKKPFVKSETKVEVKKEVKEKKSKTKAKAE
jgi:small subunit ribosomal protein S16